MANGKVTIDLVVNNRGTGSVNQLKSSIDGISGATNRMGGIFKSVLGANLVSGAVIGGFQTLKGEVSNLFSTMQESGAAINTFRGNMELIGKSDKEIKRLETAFQSYAEKTKYSSSDMLSTYAQLEMSGVKAADEVVKGMAGLAASAENPKQAMKSLSQQMTQMIAKPTVTWQDFKIMMEQAPGAMSQVAKEMGMSMSELITKIKDSEIGTEDFIAAVNKVGNSKGFQDQATQVKTVGEAVDQVRETIANKLLSINDQVTRVAADISGSFQKAFSDFDFSQIESSFKKLGGIKINWDGIFTGLLSVIDTVGASFASFVAGFNKGFDTSSFDRLGEALGKVDFTGIAEGFGEFVGNVATAATNIATSLTQITTTIDGLVGGFGNLLGSIDADTLTMIAAGFVTLKGAIMGLNVIQGITTMFTTFTTAISGGSTAWQAFSLALNTNPIMLAITAISAIVGALTWFFTQTETGRQIWSDFMSFLGTIWQGLQATWSAAWTAIVGFLSGLWNGVVGTGKAIWGGLTGFFGGLWNGISSTFSSVWNAIRSTLSGIWNGIVNTGKGLWNGLTGFFSGLWNGIKNVFTSIWNGIKSSVLAVWNGMKSAASGAFNGIKNTISGVINGVKNVFNGLKNINLLNAGRAILDGFLNGLRSAWRGVQDFVGGIAGWIKKNKGPIEYDRRLLIPEGNAIMEGLNKGMSRGWEDGKRQVKSIAGDIKQMMTGINGGTGEFKIGVQANHLSELRSQTLAGSLDELKQEFKTTVSSALETARTAVARPVALNVDGATLAETTGNSTFNTQARISKINERYS